MNRSENAEDKKQKQKKQKITPYQAIEYIAGRGRVKGGGGGD